MLATVATVAPLWLAGMTGTADGGDATRHPVRTTPAADGPASPDARALSVLRRWDRLRSHAWATGDPAALIRLYVTGSTTGERDADDLRRWTRRGLRVAGLRQQVAELRVTDRHPGRLVLVVTERTVGGVAAGASRPTAVPASAWATHRILMRRTAAGWKVAEASAQPAR